MSFSPSCSTSLYPDQLHKLQSIHFSCLNIQDLKHTTPFIELFADYSPLASSLLSRVPILLLQFTKHHSTIAYPFPFKNGWSFILRGSQRQQLPVQPSLIDDHDYRRRTTNASSTYSCYLRAAGNRPCDRPPLKWHEYRF